jgi:hypothetical protein
VSHEDFDPTSDGKRVTCGCGLTFSDQRALAQHLQDAGRVAGAFPVPTERAKDPLFDLPPVEVVPQRPVDYRAVALDAAAMSCAEGEPPYRVLERADDFLRWLEDR